VNRDIAKGKADMNHKERETIPATNGRCGQVSKHTPQVIAGGGATRGYQARVWFEVRGRGYVAGYICSPHSRRSLARADSERIDPHYSDKSRYRRRKAK